MNRIPFIQLGVALSILSIFGALTVGAHLYLDAVTARAVSLGQEVAQKESEALRIASARATLPLLEEADRTVAKHLVRTSDIVPFLEQLEKQGTSQGAVVTVLSVQPTQNSNEPRVTIALTITGTFDSVLRTLSAIEYGLYDILIATVTVTKVSTEGVSGGWRASVTLSVGTDVEQSLEKK